MEFRETFVKFGELYQSLKDPENRTKIYIFIAVLYTLIISVLTFIGSLMLFNYINLNYTQKTIVTLLLILFATYLYYTVDWVSLGNILSKIRNLLNFALSKINPSDSNANFSQAKRFENSLVINYLYRNTQYTVYVPYTDKNMSSYTDIKVFAEIIKDGATEDVEITQQSGVKYNISPQDINAYKIYSTNSTGNIMQEVFGSDILELKAQELPFTE